MLLLMLKPKPAPELALEAPLQLLDMEREFMLCVSCVPRTLLAGLPQFLALGFRLPSEFSVWRVACSGLPLLLLCLLFVRLLKLPVASCQLLLVVAAASAAQLMLWLLPLATCHLPLTSCRMPLAHFCGCHPLAFCALT